MSVTTSPSRADAALPGPAGNTRRAGPAAQSRDRPASALLLTPGGLGVTEVTLVAVTVGFGVPRPTAVVAVLGYRIVNYWLPLLPGAVAYIRLRLSRNTADRPPHPGHSPS